MNLLKNIVSTIFLSQMCVSYAFDRYRLPKHIQPTNYNLDIKVNPEELHFNGTVVITLEVLNGTTDRLFLHADHNYISIERIELNGTECNFSLFEDPATQIFPVKCPMEFRSSQELVIVYMGKFSREMNGLYKSTYDEEILVATMFEPIYARRAFPCFDEPGFKATFEITVEHPNLYKVLANTPLAKGVITRKFARTSFEKTPKMSTYLVAIIVSRFEPAIKKDQAFNVFARSSAAKNVGIATKYGQQLFDLMSEWTGIRYDDLGNPQGYLVAVPDFAAGAMENWGLITFREIDLLDDGNKTSSESFQRIISVISHEIAHQWFGNLVTLDWWSNTWLNEGFAEYFGKLTANRVNNGSMELDKQIMVHVMQAIMEKDAVLSAPPLSSAENSVRTLLEITTKSDEFAYFKGESIIRMMEFILGEKAFKTGIQNYLIHNKYKNTNPEMLLKELQDEAENNLLNFDEKMHNWIYESGFPLLNVLQTNRSTVTITQKRFCITKICNSETQWYVPISYTTGEMNNFNVNISHWLEPNQTLTIPHDSLDWIIFNLQGSGYYRVNYDTNLWNNIINVLNTKEERQSIHPLNRAQLVDDIFHIAQIGEISYEKAFSLANYLKRETSYYPWVSAIRSFSYLILNIDFEYEKRLKDWMLDLIKNTLPKKMKTNRTHIDSLQHTLITEFACKLGQKECLHHARKWFLKFKNGNSPLSVNKKYIILCYGLMESDDFKEDYLFLLDIFKNSNSPHEQNILLSALGCMKDEELLLSYLNFTLIQPSPIKEQDFATVFNSVYYNNKIGLEVALNFMNKNFKAMEISYGDPTILSRLMLDIAEHISRPNEIEMMNNILNNHKDNENVKLTAPSIMEVINSNQQWKAEYGNEIKTILRKMKNNAPQYTANSNIVIMAILVLSFGLHINLNLLF